MYAYEHGGNVAFEPGGANLLDLSANINPLGPPAGVAEAVMKDFIHVNRYPDCFSTALRQKLSAFEGVSAERIFCGNGASDIIFRLPVAIRPKKALLAAPTFSDYGRALRAFGAEIKLYGLKAEQGFEPEQTLLEHMTKDVGLVYICNPNNPTGVLMKRELLETVLKRARTNNTVVAVDECFMDFVENAADYTAKPLLDTYENLIILKAFTKLFAMPGIRLGYALSGSRELTEKLYGCGADWAVSNLAQAAGIAALENAAPYVAQTVTYVKRQREWLQQQFKKLGFTVFDSRANYVFFRNDGPHNVQKHLAAARIRIRGCANYAGLDERYYRAAVSSEADNRALIQCLEELKWHSRL